jgi:BASS family bile acid:Na+ symporter
VATWFQRIANSPEETAADRPSGETAAV